MGAWIQRSYLGWSRAYAVGFSIGNKGYIGTGYVGSYPYYYRDFWEYDPSTDTWTKKANFGGVARSDAVGFSIGNKGYIGTGCALPNYFKDFWEYDPSTNTWTQKADFGGTARAGAVGFSIGNKGYVGTGWGDYGHFRDFWEYDPSTNSWTQKADFGGVARAYAVGFSIGNKGYIGTGSVYPNYFKDFWEYDPSTNSWTQKADFGGTARAYAVGLSISNKGYIGTGYGGSNYLRDFWEYDPSTNTWTRIADIYGERAGAVGFSIGDRIYVGTGRDSYGFLSDFWEFLPSIVKTTSATNVRDTVGTLNGELLTLGGNSPVACYFKYRKSSDSQWTNTPVQNKTSPGAFSYTVTGLQKGTTYYFKAVAEYGDSTDEGEILSFTTIGVTTGIYNPGTAWIQKDNFAGTARFYATGFSIGSKGYVGLGWNNGYLNDFFEYNSYTNSWSQKANFPGGGRTCATSFSVGSKGYVSCGKLFDGSFTRDLWEYDPSTNTWTQKANFAGEARMGAVGFAIGNRGYLGAGHDSDYTYFRDFWEYNPFTNLWTQKADFGGTARAYAVGFSILDKGYVGTGLNDINYFKDFWEYNPSTNSWTRKADFGGVARAGAVGFSVNYKGYIGTGYDGSNYLRDFWEYDPSTNTWTQKADFAGVRAYAVGLSIDGKGCVGTGYDGSNSFRDFWLFDPLANTYIGATHITRDSARLNGTLDGLGKDGDGNDYTFNCYFRYRKLGTQSWDNALPKVVKSSTGPYYIDVSGLSSGSVYEFQAMAECTAGIYYADNTLTFVTPKAPATIQTNDATNVSQNSATLSGLVVSLGDYESLMCYFNWKQKNTETWNTTSPAVEMSGVGAFSYALSGLSSGITYAFQAVGQYDNEYFYGSIKEFTTSGLAMPVVETRPATGIRKDSASLVVELISLGDYPYAEVFGQYREIGEDEWIETPEEIVYSPGVISIAISGLTRGNTYEYRAVAETPGGRVYGDTKSFKAETWIFDHWEGDITGSENPKTITMDKSKNVRAVFIREP
jgi:N-acetylneuraminic acid mutarotase